MEDKLWFSQPVKVWARGRPRRIMHVEQAAETLLHDWPEKWKTAAANREARKSCLAALEGELKPDDVRRKFIDAAKEAHILDYQRK